MKIIGHQKILNLLEKEVACDCFVQAYLFCGPEHVGKFTVAQDFARKILGAEKDGSGENVPDLLILRPEVEEEKDLVRKKPITVENMRGLIHALSLTGGLGRRVAIIDDADQMNAQAQNALLKTLEEGFEGATIILVSHDEDKMLRTVRSRCRRVRFANVSMENLMEWGNGNSDADHDHLSRCAIWSFGSPGKFLEFLKDSQALSERQRSFLELEKMFSLSIAEKFSAAEEWAKNKDELSGKLSLWSVFLRNAIIGKSGFRLPVAPEKKMELIEILTDAEKALRSTNANPKLVMENILLKF